MTGFLAVGTGRCGTKAFARFAYELGGVVHHEKQGKFLGGTWEQPDAGKLIQFLRDGGSYDGVVGYPFLPYVAPVRRSLPGVRVICLHRDKDGFVGSAVRRLPPPRRVRNMPLGLGAFPTKNSAYRWYWEMYEEAMAKIPDAIHVDVHKEDNPLTLERVREVLS